MQGQSSTSTQHDNDDVGRVRGTSTVSSRRWCSRILEPYQYAIPYMYCTVQYRYSIPYSTLKHAYITRIARPVPAHGELDGARPIDRAHSNGFMLAGLSIGQSPVPPF